MDDTLGAALVAVLVALLSYLRVELEVRAAQRHREQLLRQVDDAKRLAGADRRASDAPGEQ